MMFFSKTLSRVLGYFEDQKIGEMQVLAEGNLEMTVPAVKLV